MKYNISEGRISSLKNVNSNKTASDPMTKSLTILIITLFSSTAFGQDTTVYEQANASMFSNDYTFIKKNQSDNFGTFIQYCGTDDMQYWCGQGVFKETKHKIFMTFDTTNNYNRITTVYTTQHSDSLYIKWFDWRGEKQEWLAFVFLTPQKINPFTKQT